MWLRTLQALLVSTAVRGECPSGWTASSASGSSKCYASVPKSASQRCYAACAAQCATAKAACPTSKELNALLASLAEGSCVIDTSSSKWVSECVYMGVTRTAAGDTFTCESAGKADGERLLFTKWAVRQPDNLDYMLGGELEACVVLVADQAMRDGVTGEWVDVAEGEWIDIACSHEARCFCEAHESSGCEAIAEDADVDSAGAAEASSGETPCEDYQAALAGGLDCSDLEGGIHSLYGGTSVYCPMTASSYEDGAALVGESWSPPAGFDSTSTVSAFCSCTCGDPATDSCAKDADTPSALGPGIECSVLNGPMFAAYGGAAMMCMTSASHYADMYAEGAAATGMDSWSPPAGFDLSSTLADICPCTCSVGGGGGGNPCVCLEAWSSPGYADCGTAQTGCADPACDGDPVPWCLVANPGCDEDRGGWFKCDCEDVPNAFWDPTFSDPMPPSVECRMVLTSSGEGSEAIASLGGLESFCSMTARAFANGATRLADVLHSWSPPAGYTWDSKIRDFCCATCKDVVASTVPPEQAGALVSLYEATGGATFGTINGWIEANPCQWYGVICMFDNVVSVWPYGAKVEGTLPTEIGSLTALNSFHWSNFDISGTLPTELGRLTNLAVLALSDTLISGVIPTQLGQLTSLSEALLQANRLAGPVPSEFGRLSNLHTLFIDVRWFASPTATCTPSEFYPPALEDGKYDNTLWSLDQKQALFTCEAVTAIWAPTAVVAVLPMLVALVAKALSKLYRRRRADVVVLPSAAQRRASPESVKTSSEKVLVSARDANASLRAQVSGILLSVGWALSVLGTVPLGVVLMRAKPDDAGSLVWLAPVGMTLMLLAVRPTDNRLITSLSVGFFIMQIVLLALFASELASLLEQKQSAEEEYEGNWWGTGDSPFFLSPCIRRLELKILLCDYSSCAHVEDPFRFDSWPTPDSGRLCLAGPNDRRVRPHRRWAPPFALLQTSRPQVQLRLGAAPQASTAVAHAAPLLPRSGPRLHRQSARFQAPPTAGRVSGRSFRAHPRRLRLRKGKFPCFPLAGRRRLPALRADYYANQSRPRPSHSR